MRRTACRQFPGMEGTQRVAPGGGNGSWSRAERGWVCQPEHGGLSSSKKSLEIETHEEAVLETHASGDRRKGAGGRENEGGQGEAPGEGLERSGKGHLSQRNWEQAGLPASDSSCPGFQPGGLGSMAGGREASGVLALRGEGADARLHSRVRKWSKRDRIINLLKKLKKYG